MATRQEIKQIQQTLKNLGFDPGPIDGLVGPRTRGAAQNYVNSLSGTAGKAAYEYYNNALGGLTSKKIIAPKEEEKKDKFILYDKEGNSYSYDVFPQAQVDAGILFQEKPTGQEEESVEDEVVEDEVVEDEKPKVSSRDDIRNIQTFLKNAGFDPGPIDGLVGPLTRGAALNYVKSLSGQAQKDAYKYYSEKLGGIGELDIDTTTTDDDEELEETEEGGKTFEEILAGIQFGPSMSANATSYEIDKINKELGLEGSTLDSAMERAKITLENPSIVYGDKEFKELQNEIFNNLTVALGNDDSNTASRLGSLFRLSALGLGYGVKMATGLMEETFATAVNALGDAFTPDKGGVLDNFIDAVSGNIGENTASTWWESISGKYRYDTFTNKFVDVSDGSKKTAKEVVQENKDVVIDTNTAPGGAGGGADEGPLYWGRYDSGSWATSTKPGKPEGFKWAWELDEFPDKNEDLYTSDKSIEDILGLVSEPEVININNQMITLYKRGENPITVPATDVGQYLSRGWSTTQPVEGGIVDISVEGTDEVGPGQVVSDKLNEFNNVPQNSILIEAGGQLFLGYEVPGAYGQLYNGNPIFMLYEVLNNDVYEAGILTKGASPQINVSLGSVQDLNQYGIIVGGTDELTDDVEHPFIRFTENFEAGKRVNPWLNDTEINPLTGVTYQQEAIEFLAEQALEQWTPETTQVRYEGSDWYRKSTTAQKTWLTTLLTQPQQAEQDIQDKKIEVKIAMEANGIASPPDALVSWVADKAVTGMWTQVYTDQQIALLADPYKPGTRDTGMVNFIEGVGVGTLDRLSVGEKTVRDLYRRYLGPSLGNASNAEIAEKAGLLRSDPDAEEQLKSYLEQQRLAMFGNYTNPTLTYNDIVQPYKNLVNQVWGQEVDETQDWFIKMVQDNDIEKAYKTLREKGIDQGVERVQNQALDDLQRSIGQGQIQQDLGANR